MAKIPKRAQSTQPNIWREKKRLITTEKKLKERK